MTRLTDFRTALNKHGGVSRQYNYKLTLSFPDGVSTTDEAKEVSLMCVSTATPKATIGEIMLPWGGREHPLPGDRTFEPMNLNILATEDMFGLILFQDWSAAFNGMETNTPSGDYSDLVTDCTLEMLAADKTTVVKTWTLQDCWPQEVGEITLDTSTQNSFGQFPVILRYLQWS